MLPEGYRPTAEFNRRIADHTLTLRQLTRPAAQLYLDRYLPDIEGDDREWILHHYAGTHIPVPIKPTPQDAFFCAAMYMAGVSLGDLAKLYRITKQTVHQKVCRRTSEAERKNLRDHPTMVDLEVLELAKRMFETAHQADPSSFMTSHPLEVGRGLLKSAASLVALDRGTGELPNRPRRYANRNISQPTEAPPAPSTPAPSQPNVLRPEEQSFLESL